MNRTAPSWHSNGVMPLAFTGPVGWAVIAAKIGLTLYFGDKLDRWLEEMLAGKEKESADKPEAIEERKRLLEDGRRQRMGVRQHIEALR